MSSADSSSPPPIPMNLAYLSLLDTFLVAQPQELSDTSLRAFFSDDPCSIYFICRRPRITIDPSGCSSTSTEVKLRFVVAGKEGQNTHVDVCFSNEWGEPLECQSAWPHTVFELIRANGELGYGGVAGACAVGFPQFPNELLDLLISAQ
jgi:hypothetical protein